MTAQIAYLQPVFNQQNPLRQLFTKQQSAFALNPMPSVAQRRQWLAALRQVLVREQQALAEAIKSDFGQRSLDETRLAELLPCLQAIESTSDQLKSWMKPSRRKVSILFQPAKARVEYQPLGVVGVIVPWNYPVFLAMGPLVGALAAGNRVMLKISEATPATGELLKTLLATIFPEDLVAVVLGDVKTGVSFSHLPFDHLLFTGSAQTGKQVMRAAAQNLTPVTLELGGKSPVIIGRDAPMAQAAARIAFGKALNAGQTCVAPDYVLVPRTRVDEFVSAYRDAMHRMYPTTLGNPDYTHIIDQRQFQRLNRYLEDASTKGANIIALYPLEQHRGRCIPPNVLLNVTDDMKVMQEEIFGPLLPIVPYDDFDDAVNYINARPRPLALYYFGHNKAEQRRIQSHTRSGGICLNDTLLQVAQDNLPFGGIGPSGMGQYHGFEGFQTFSKARSVLSKSRFNPASFIYPPYGKATLRLLYRLFIR
ncbi:coniferyl aldehyde dehydrogenase [Pseudomonas sp. nanlin1]|uniref:coniferyl aldehyde dehydrogenase n=1 Tax=Pseudomonas sp. nanlin1 TaxID=3040605 RepID=UPI003890492A